MGYNRSLLIRYNNLSKEIGKNRELNDSYQTLGLKTSFMVFTLEALLLLKQKIFRNCRARNLKSSFYAGSIHKTRESGKEIAVVLKNSNHNYRQSRIR